MKAFLDFYKMTDKLAPILKIEQSIYDLQRKTHQQMVGGFEIEDMTNEMAYSINDTVCLWRCE